MNYCSIQDAWGSSNISNNFNKYIENKSVTQSNNKPNEYPKPNENPKPISTNNIEHFHEYNCNDFFLHLQKCKKCQMKIFNNNKTILSHLYTLSQDNKDFIILGLIVLFVLLFINLVNNLTKN
jgi:hypothetical protein